jgi:molybdopterin converting factor small subunit
VPTLRLFAAAAEAAGVRQAPATGASVGEVLDDAVRRFGPALAALLPTCAVWVNGEPAEPDQPLGANDEVAVLPPVSGG